MGLLISTPTRGMYQHLLLETGDGSLGGSANQELESARCLHPNV